MSKSLYWMSAGHVSILIEVDDSADLDGRFPAHDVESDVPLTVNGWAVTLDRARPEEIPT